MYAFKALKNITSIKIKTNTFLIKGFSEFTSATHSDDHSISVFDYLTLGQQPYEDREPMDSVHMQHLYDRLESYSVELMLKKIERVQKLSDEVLSVETDLLEVSCSFYMFSLHTKNKFLENC